MASQTSAASGSSQNITLPDLPELYKSNFLDILLPPSDDDNDFTMVDPSESDRTAAESTGPQNAMINALKGSTNLTFTENGAPALKSTLSATLDAFNCLQPKTFGETVSNLLNAAWEEDPAMTLRIIWNLRSIHEGKGQKEIFYQAFGWLYDNHPRTAIANLHVLVDRVCEAPASKKIPGLPHGYWKDLLNILALAAVNELSGISKEAVFLHGRVDREDRSGTYWRVRAKDEEERQKRISAHEKRTAEEQAGAKRIRAAKIQQTHADLASKLEKDTKFKALFITVARLFADRLVEDLKIARQMEPLEQGDEKRVELSKQLSLAAKWAPTPACSHDKVTNIATAISALIHDSQVFDKYPAALKAAKLGSVERYEILRSFYQRWVLTDLRQKLACPEPLMAGQKWKEIRYNRVPSKAMKNNTPVFIKNDPEGFEKYLLKVEKGRKTISGATRFPHELVKEVLVLGTAASVPDPGPKEKMAVVKKVKKELAATQLRVAEAQWKTLVGDLKQAGTLDNCIAVCDVSGSMGSLYSGGQAGKKEEDQPIYPSVALSLVIASIAKPPFNGGFITFSSNPEYVTVDLNISLYEQIRDMESTNWGQSTDLNAVFMKLLLPLAIKNKVPKEEMIKRLFIFTDMQFDYCHCGGNATAAKWESNYDVIEKAYQDAGYDVPQIVYWDLQNEDGLKTVEVESDRKGVAMMNGFSPAMLKVFMSEREIKPEGWEDVTADGESKTVDVDDEFTPLNVMKKALFHSSYDGLRVLD